MAERAVLQNIQELARELDQNSGIFTLVKGPIGGRPHWFFIEIAPSLYPAFMEAQARGGYSINRYARRILSGGEGDAPPPEALDKIKAEHPEMHFGFEKEVETIMESAKNVDSRS